MKFLATSRSLLVMISLNKSSPSIAGRLRNISVRFECSSCLGCENAEQCNIMCFSLSTLPLGQYLHILSFSGILVGLWCLPVSIARLCAHMLI